MYAARKGNDSTWHNNILPVLRPHSRLLLRLVVVIKKKATNMIHVLLSERTAWHLPICEIHPTKSLHSTLRRFMVELFGAEVAPHRPHGVLSVSIIYNISKLKLSFVALLKLNYLNHGFKLIE